MKKTKIIVGLAFGDEGKGSLTDYLCRTEGATLVVRYNGGSQAAHNVVTDDGKHHMFAQIGSGSFVGGVKTLLSKFMLWDPILLAHEVNSVSEKVGEHMLGRHFIDEQAPVITPFHVATNRIREWVRGGARHGSCGRGIGETASDLVHRPNDVIRAGDLRNPRKIIPLLARIQKRRCEEMEGWSADLRYALPELVHFINMLRSPDEVNKIAEVYYKLAGEYNILDKAAVGKMIQAEDSIFEGAQGVLLDEWHGFHPHTTWSTITTKNAHEILDESGFVGDREVIGILRSFGTRHGAGPFVTEDPAMRYIYPQEHNGQNDWQGTFRVGWFDGVQLRYALQCLARVGGIDSIALTHLDVFGRGKIIPFTNEYSSKKEGSIKDLIPSFEHDHAHEEELTKLLLASKPVRSGEFKTAQEAIEFVQDTAKAKAKYLSYGPCPKDKTTV